MTDTDMLNAMVYKVLENGNADANAVSQPLLTQMFTYDQMLAAINQRQWRFLKDTGCVVTRYVVNLPATTSRVTLPSDCIMVRRVTWKPVGGKAYSLPRADKMELDSGLSDWQSNPDQQPTAYNETLEPTLTIELGKNPPTGGTMTILYVQAPAALTGSGASLTVPDSFTWAVMYGAIGDLLSSDGESLDPQRAQYCESRYDMGVELCRILLRGMEDA